MQYTQIPTDTFKNIQLNAGIIVDTFTPATGEIGNLIGATTGGVNFADNPEFVDFGEDIDNCPKNTMELKVLDGRDVNISGTFVTVTPALAKRLSGAADIASGDATHIVPRNDLTSTDFTDIWWIGDYSDVNTDGTGQSVQRAGYVAIHMMNTLSTGGFQIQSTDKEKGQFAFEFTAHTSLSSPTTVPYELYIKEGIAAA